MEAGKSESDPGPSHESDVIEEDSIHSEVSKQQLKDALVYLESLLRNRNLIAAEPSSSMNEKAMLIEEEMFENTLQMLAEKSLVLDEELIHMNEIDDNNAYEEVKTSPIANESSEYEPDQKKSKEYDYIPLDSKIRAVTLAKEHPHWSLKNLQKKGCSRLKSMRYLSRWEEQIKSGGSKFDKYCIVDSWTYDRFVEARQNFHQITTRNLQQWALAAASQFQDFEFKASKTWVTEFKKKHRIRQRKITKFVSRKEMASQDEILAAADTFRIQTRTLIPNFDQDFIINTDQTGTWRAVHKFHMT